MMIIRHFFILFLLLSWPFVSLAEVTLNLKSEFLSQSTIDAPGEIGGLPFGLGASFRNNNNFLSISYRYGDYSVNPDKQLEESFEIEGDGHRLGVDVSAGKFINKNLLVFVNVYGGQRGNRFALTSKSDTAQPGNFTEVGYTELVGKLGVGVTYAYPFSRYFAGAATLSACVAVNEHDGGNTITGIDSHELNKSYSGYGPCASAEINAIVAFTRKFGFTGSLRKTSTTYTKSDKPNWYSEDFSAGITVYFRFI